MRVSRTNRATDKDDSIYRASVASRGKNDFSQTNYVICSRCWNTCSVENKIVGHLAVLNCIWFLQLLVVLGYFVPVNFIFYLCGSCVSCAFGVCIMCFMGMGQVPEKTADDADCPKPDWSSPDFQGWQNYGCPSVCPSVPSIDSSSVVSWVVRLEQVTKLIKTQTLFIIQTV